MENRQQSLPHGQKTLLLSIQTSEHGIAVYIKVNEGHSVKTEEFDPAGEIILDLDAGGNLLGIELLSLNPGIPGYIREIAEQFDVPELIHHFHAENLHQVFA